MSDKTRYSDKELQEFNSIIDAKLKSAHEELEYYLQQISGAEKGEATRLKGLDDAAEFTDNERLQTLAARQNKLIKHLNNAKLRIENKVYGVCRETGELISKERLKAVPHATLSIKAKQKRNDN